MRASCIFVLAMSGTGAAAASVTNSVWEVDKIAEVDFGMVSGTRVGAVSVGTTSDGRVWLTAQDALQFACGGASDGRAQQKLAAMIKADGALEGFHRGRWKPADGPREGGLGAWSVSLSTLKDFVRTQALLARQSVAEGGAGARSLAMNVHVQAMNVHVWTAPERACAAARRRRRCRAGLWLALRLRLPHRASARQAAVSRHRRCCSSSTSCSFVCKVARRGSKSALVGFRHAESLSPPRY